MHDLSRRRFVTGGMTIGALAFVGFETARTAGANPAGAPDLPASIFARRARFENWDGAIVTDELWTVRPGSVEQIVELAAWAVAAGYRLRPQGQRHSWSPVTVSPGTPANARILLVDMSGLTGATMVGDAADVRTGTLMVDMLAFLHANGRSLLAAPAVGDITVGGALAIAGHGTGLPVQADAQDRRSGFGTLSGVVRSLTAVVWDPSENRYREQRFDRDHPDAKAMLTHVGRALITSVTLTTVPDYYLHCRNHTDIPSG